MDKSKRRGSEWYARRVRKMKDNFYKRLHEVEAFCNKYFDKLYADTIYPADAQVVPEATSIVSLGVSDETSSETSSRKFEPLWISGRKDYDTGNSRQSRWNNTLGVRPEEIPSFQAPWFYCKSGKRVPRHKKQRLTAEEKIQHHQIIGMIDDLLWRISPEYKPAALAIYDHQAGSFIPQHPLEWADRFGDPEKMALKFRDHLRIEKDFLRLEANA